MHRSIDGAPAYDWTVAGEKSRGAPRRQKKKPKAVKPAKTAPQSIARPAEPASKS